MTKLSDYEIVCQTAETFRDAIHEALNYFHATEGKRGRSREDVILLLEHAYEARKNLPESP